MVTDGYFILKEQSTQINDAELKTRRFYLIMIRLPMELQMIVCNRLLGLKNQDLIPSSMINTVLTEIVEQELT